MATIETALTRLLGIQHPILLAPMGSAAGGKLAAAVTHAGGLGMLGSGYADEKAIRRELVEAGNAKVGIGFILWALDKNPSALDVALDARPAAVMLSFGDPTPYTGGAAAPARGATKRNSSPASISHGRRMCLDVIAISFRVTDAAQWIAPGGPLRHKPAGHLWH